MWDELKEAPLIWRLIAFVIIPIAAIFACGILGVLGYLIIDRSANPIQPTNQEIVADVPAPTMPPSEANVNTPGATPLPTPSEISYELNWKIEDGQPIAYNTAMEVSECCTSVDYDQIFNFGQSDENNELSSYFEERFEELKNSQPSYSIVSILEKKADGNISVKMVLDNVEVPEQKAEDSMGEFYGQMLKGMEGSVQLQGDITPEGEIASPYIAQQQKNLLALFFELPVGPVKVGDTWQIDLTCITLNSAQFKIENSERVNQVTLKEIVETPEGELVAVLDYLIAESVEGEQTIPFFAKEPVPTTMKCSFLGRGEFLIEQGRWQAFSAENTIQSTGIVTSNVTQQLALTPLDKVPEYSEDENAADTAAIDASEPTPETQEVTTQKSNEGTEDTNVELGQCKFVSEEVIGPTEQATLWSGSYGYAGPPEGPPLATESLVLLDVVNIEPPETLEVHGKTFTRYPDSEIYQFTIEADPNRKPIPEVNLTLMSVEKDVEDPITLNLDGKDYPLKLDYAMDEFARNLAGDDEHCIYLPPEISKIAIDAMKNR